MLIHNGVFGNSDDLGQIGITKPSEVVRGQSKGAFNKVAHCAKLVLHDNRQSRTTLSELLRII